MKKWIITVSVILAVIIVAGSIFLFGGGDERTAAINAAMEHSGVTRDDAKFLICTREIDDLRTHYNVSFYANGIEYDYEVLPDGTLIDADRDSIF